VILHMTNCAKKIYLSENFVFTTLCLISTAVYSKFLHSVMKIHVILHMTNCAKKFMQVKILRSPLTRITDGKAIGK
jgi:hypothetical protein